MPDVLYDLPLLIDCDGIPVHGRILRASGRDIEVIIDSPYSGTQAGGHIPLLPVAPYDAQGRFLRYVVDGQLTEVGREIAEDKLAEIYRATPPASSAP